MQYRSEFESQLSEALRETVKIPVSAGFADRVMKKYRKRLAYASRMAVYRELVPAWAKWVMMGGVVALLIAGLWAAETSPNTSKGFWEGNFLSGYTSYLIFLLALALTLGLLSFLDGFLKKRTSH